MKPFFDWDLILKHLDHSLTSIEEEDLNQWLRSDPGNAEYFNQVIKIWQTADSPLPGPDTSNAWQQILDKTGINKQARRSTKQPTTENLILALFQPIVHSVIVRAAAILIVIIISAYYLLVPSQAPDMHDVVVSFGQQKEITLPDGSRLILDAGSHFRYPDQFEKTKREVILNGEAYFDIHPDAHKPFIIQANQALITVVGTTFNVRAWEKNDQVIVAVENGRVKLRSRLHNKPASEVLIRKNQVSILYGEEKPSVPEYGDISTYLTWRERSMYFQSVPLQEVLDQLQRWHNLDFELPEANSAEILVTILIENKPIGEILDVIALMNDFNYQQQDGKVIFSIKE